MSTTPNSVITPQTPNFGAGGIQVSAANTATDGTGTVSTIYTAGANGSKVDQICIKFSGNCVQSVLRVFWNNGSSNGTATNNGFFTEIQIPAVTNFAQNLAQPDIVWPIGRTLPAGYKLNVTLGTAIAAYIAVTASGGDL